MKLDVIPSSEASTEPWYAEGLNFTCQQCGNCCTGGPGYVWISQAEIALLAEHLKLTVDAVIEKYCRKIGSRISLKERRRTSGNYDCIFLKEQKVEGNGDKVELTRRVCTVYPVRPLQCRTWPFWEGNLQDEKSWNRAAKRCHGMNQGRKFALPQIVELRDAKTWPKRAPTSDAKERK